MNIVFIAIYFGGLTAIVAWIVFFYTKYQAKKHLPEVVENILGFVLFLLAFGGGFLLLNEYKKQIVEDHQHQQAMYCLGTERDGEPLTDNQCEYFQDVLNGKYYKD